MVNLNPDTRPSLIAKITDLGDQLAWAEFVENYQPVVERFLQRHALQHADSVDIAQEVLCRVAKSIGSWDGGLGHSTFRGWLYQITRNQTIDYLRRTAIDRSMVRLDHGEWNQFAEPTEAVDAGFRLEYEKQLFLWAAGQIKPLFKPINWQAFWMSAVDGQAIDFVAENLQIDSSLVYVARSRITARIAKLVQARLNETSSFAITDGDRS